MKTIDDNWKGYTLDQLRVKRLVTIAKIDMEKMRLEHLTEKYTGNGEGEPQPGIFNKLLGALDYVDYGMLAYKLGKTVFKLFRRKRK